MKNKIVNRKAGQLYEDNFGLFYVFNELELKLSFYSFCSLSLRIETLFVIICSINLRLLGSEGNFIGSIFIALPIFCSNFFIRNFFFCYHCAFCYSELISCKSKRIELLI